MKIPFSDFYGPNAGYVADLYERYLEDPTAVDEETRAYFRQHVTVSADGDLMRNGAGTVRAQAVTEASDLATSGDLAGVISLVNLANAIREYGHLDAQLDPLGSPPPGDPSLQLETHGLTEELLRKLPSDAVGGPIAARTDSAWAAIQELRIIYMSTTGYDYDHLRNPDERGWLREMAESRRFRPPTDPIDNLHLLDRLTQVEAFEQFLQRTFPGKTRFSIEGLDVMVPVLDEIVVGSAESGIYTLLIGMAHRGRLNVLAHVLNKPYSEILLEFKDPVKPVAFSNDLGWTGDVKYHAGSHRCVTAAEASRIANGDIEGNELVDVDITIAPNPSHLELVNPVVEGMARAAGTLAGKAGAPTFDHHVSLPVLIHGDAAFPAQGIVAETLNLSRIDGYLTGGTIHIIANNQLGFTTEPRDGRSTIYASDLAKGFKIPVVHVNADDPVACIEAARLAVAYRNKFQKDFLIDLIGYRRYGHNEGDEPRFTQPLLYATIKDHPTVRALWAQQLVDNDSIEEEDAAALVDERLQNLQASLDDLSVEEADLGPELKPPPPGAARRVDTTLDRDRLLALVDALGQTPEEFHSNPKLERVMNRRRKVAEAPTERNVDWGFAEHLAMATILEAGTPIRFTGEDVERGTFSHRHAVLYDIEDGRPYVPLQHLTTSRASFEIRNSPLSENAALGFEYGYNIHSPAQLVLWEAQYGDFINGAQPIVDEFLVAGRAKWEQTPSMVLLLPHGYEGQGPDHSTGRLERFLQLAAETNIRVANCTTAAQYYHLLRRQAALLETDPLPLIVMTPKSLLRQTLAMSSLQELAEGHWQPVIDDEDVVPDAVRCLLLCSGKVYVDMVTSDYRKEQLATAIVRVEQLYPFPADEIRTILDRYEYLDEVIWVQEEAQNMGAWEFVRPQLLHLLNGRLPLRYVGRPRRSSPAEGSAAWHQRNQKLILATAFQVEQVVIRGPALSERTSATI